MIKWMLKRSDLSLRKTRIRLTIILMNDEMIIK